MKERLKTVLLIFLIISAVYLLLRTWVYDNRLLEETRLASNPVFAALFGIHYDPEPEEWAPERLVYSRAAVAPAVCAVTRDGVRTGAQYDGRVREVYEAFTPLLISAFDNAENSREITRSEWQTLLGRDSVYFSFTGELPIPLIAAWLSADSPGHDNLAGVALAFGKEQTELLWQTSDGSFRCAGTVASLDGWPDLPDLDPCIQVGQSGQLLIEETASRSAALISAPPDIRNDLSVYTSFLEALDLNPLSTAFYPKGDTRVYVGGDRERNCSFSPDGTIRYSGAASAEEGSRLYIPGDSQSPAGTVLWAWETLSLLTGAMGDACFEVSGITVSGDAVTVDFAITAYGVPLLWDFASVTVGGNTVRDMTIKLCRVSRSGELSAPLPLKQASALLPQDTEDARLTLRYVADGEGTAHVFWVTVG